MGNITSRDTAVCFVIFNPAESKRILMNYLYTVNLLTLQEIPWFTMELAFEDRDFEIPEGPNIFRVRSNSYMFHKERMCRIMERKIPKRFTKIVFMDADLIFSKNEWYSTMSKMLNTHDAVQGFENCHWMDLSYKKVTLTRPTVVTMKEKTFTHLHHPGFVWGFRRDWFKKYGFFDLAISGSGDTLSAAAWLHKDLPINSKSTPMSIKYAYESYKVKIQPRLGYLKGIDVYHLYHGSRKNRQYVERHNKLEIQQDIRRLIWINKDEMYEWRLTERWNPIFKSYFESREDDSCDND